MRASTTSSMMIRRRSANGALLRMRALLALAAISLLPVSTVCRLRRACTAVLTERAERSKDRAWGAPGI